MTKVKSQEAPIPMYRESNPKIDLIIDGSYVSTTKWSRTLKDAVRHYKESNPDVVGLVEACFNDYQGRK